MAVTADVHFVEGVRDLVARFERDGAGRHELGDGAGEQLRRVGVDLHQRVALAEDAGQLTLVDDHHAADPLVDHLFEDVADGRIRGDSRRLFGPQPLDAVAQQVGLDA